LKNNRPKRKLPKKVSKLKFNNVNCGLLITLPQKILEPPRDLSLKRFNKFWLKDFPPCLSTSKKELIIEEMTFVENIYLIAFDDFML